MPVYFTCRVPTFTTKQVPSLGEQLGSWDPPPHTHTHTHTHTGARLGNPSGDGLFSERSAHKTAQYQAGVPKSQLLIVSFSAASASVEKSEDLSFHLRRRLCVGLIGIPQRSQLCRNCSGRE